MKKLIFFTSCLLFLFSTAVADWNPGDPHKMHFPQLPDPTGWDVRAQYYESLADDWMCNATGLVTDFHIWGSWKGDSISDDIQFIHTAIHSDDPIGDQGIPGEDPLNQWSKPLEQIWHKDFQPGEWTSRLYGIGDQGWYDPKTDLVIERDHTQIWQYNFFIDPLEAFHQEQGKIYWLEISFGVFDANEFGWKTSKDHWNDDGVWSKYMPNRVWQGELVDPLPPYESLDLAFVITPEPATVAFLGFGVVALLRKKHRA